MRRLLVAAILLVGASAAGCAAPIQTMSPGGTTVVGTGTVTAVTVRGEGRPDRLYLVECDALAVGDAHCQWHRVPAPSVAP